MTNQASELFELCKKVYELTGWTDTDYYWHEDGKALYTPAHSEVKKFSYYVCPLYNSDDLLGKLPPVVQDSYDKKFRHIQMWINGDGEAIACYVEPYDKEFRGAYTASSDSMLKALLKLTIALSEAGELNG